MQIVLNVDKVGGKVDTMLTEPMNPIDLAEIFSALANSAIRKAREAAKPKVIMPDKNIV